MEENKNNDVIYDLEDEGQAAEVMEGGHPDRQSEGQPADVATNDPYLVSVQKPTDCVSGPAVIMTDLNKEEAGVENASGASGRMTASLEEEEVSPRKEIDRMVKEMGAKTLLEIIRDNRNAAITQILKEVEASRRYDLPSGNSAALNCDSIFELAALA